MSYIYTFLHFSLIFFFLTLKFDFFLELRTVKSSSCPFWRICFAAVCIENGLADLKTWMLQKSSSMTWTVRSVKTRSVCGLLKRHTLQSCQKMRMKLKFRATGRMGVHSQHRLDVEGPEASMVNFYGLLEVKMFFFPEIEYIKMMLWKMISPSNQAILCMSNFIWVTLLELDLSNWWVCGTLGRSQKSPKFQPCWKVASGKVKISTFFVTPNGPPIFFWFQGFRRGVNFQELHSWRSPRKQKPLSQF